MSTHRETAHIAKYDGQNYSLWKLGLFVLFEQHNLTDLVTGEQLIPKEVENINHVLIFKIFINSKYISARRNSMMIEPF
jgi:hypothetical protein